MLLKLQLHLRRLIMALVNRIVIEVGEILAPWSAVDRTWLGAPWRTAH